MRPDMAQVIIERPRGGRRYKTPKGSRRRLQRGLDAGPRREGMKRVWGGGTKSLNEHLGPLRRFLLGQVGRPWDQVFAEICEHLRVDSAVQDHVRDHVWDYVERNVIVVNGEPCFGAGWWHGRPLRGSWRDLYVCPRSGLLKPVPRYRRRMAVRPARPPVRVGELSQCRWIRDAWHLVTLQPVPRGDAGVSRCVATDIVLGKRVSELGALRLRAEYGGSLFAVAMRQLARRELRSLPVAR
jgi:hypothetical protein